jgi:hypothetical protein
MVGGKNVSETGGPGGRPGLATNSQARIRKPKPTMFTYNAVMVGVVRRRDEGLQRRDEPGGGVRALC